MYSKDVTHACNKSFREYVQKHTDLDVKPEEIGPIDGAKGEGPFKYSFHGTGFAGQTASIDVVNYKRPGCWNRKYRGKFKANDKGYSCYTSFHGQHDQKMGIRTVECDDWPGTSFWAWEDG